MSAAVLTRRAFLALGGGLAVSFSAGCSLVPPIPRRPSPDAEAATGWIQLDPQGRWRLWSPRVEMGQGVHDALRIVAAQALGIGSGAVAVQALSTADIALVKATVGSDSMREIAPLLHDACLSLKAQVLQRAGARLGAAADTLQLAEHEVRAADGRTLALALLTPGPVAPVPGRAAPGALAPDPLQDPLQDPLPQWQALLHGAAVFTADVTLPGLVHATVLRPPTVAEVPAPLQSWQGQAVREDPACLAVLEMTELAGPAIVAATPQALLRLRERAAPRWQVAPAGDPVSMVDVDAAQAQGRITRGSGQVDPGPWSVDLRLDVPLAAHAAMEPRCAVARFDAQGEGVKLEVWCATQDPFYVRDVLARDHGLPSEAIVVHAMRLGGSFGGRTIATVEREAARIARAVGRPVKLQWTREDEFRAAFHRPPSSHRVRVRLDESGRISQWWHAVSSSHVLFTNAGLPPWMQRLTDFIGDGGTARGQRLPYAVGRTRLDLTLTRLPVYTGPWRGLGAGPNVLAIELAMDAAARVARQDPVAFRLAHLDGAPHDPETGDPARLAVCLRRLDEVMRADAGAVPGAGEVTARGVGCGIYKARSHAAAGAEVALQVNASGQVAGIRVLRMWCTHDCGHVVDADGVRAQVQGNLVWTLGMVLHEQLQAPGGIVEPAQFGAYALPRITDVPPMDIHLIHNDKPASGAGETAMVAGAGAIANAVIAALARVRPAGPAPSRWTLPLTPDSLLAA